MVDYGTRVRMAREARKMSQEDLAQAVGTTQSTIDRIEGGQTQRSRYLPEIAFLLGLQFPMGERASTPDVPPPSEPSRRPVEISPPPFFENFDAPAIDKGQFPRDVPMIGIAACGDDASFTLNGQTGDYARRPPGLEGKRSVYALNTCGDSMYPAFRHGDLVYVDPNRTPAIGEDAVIELHPEDPRSGEPGKGFLKRVKKIGGGKIVCEQFNPAEEVVFDREEVKNFHRVIPWGEVLGY